MHRLAQRPISGMLAACDAGDALASSTFAHLAMVRINCGSVGRVLR
jgi:hypothetical protein